MRRIFVALCLSMLMAGAVAQPQPSAQSYVPQPGEHGKDVMWLPSDDVMVTRILDLAKVTPRDTVMDLGSGDGRTVIAAARRGAQALGVEFNPDLVEYSKRRAEKARVGDRARFVQGDLFETDLSQATVITLFLLEEINLKLRPKLLELQPGTRVVSNYFTMGDWRADRSAAATEKEGCTAYCVAYLWVVPATVEGAWHTPQGELTLRQSYQMVTGSLKADGKEIAVKGRLRGDWLSFRAGSSQYSGRVDGDAIKGAIKADRAHRQWSAIRKKA